MNWIIEIAILWSSIIFLVIFSQLLISYFREEWFYEIHYLKENPDEAIEKGMKSVIERQSP